MAGNQENHIFKSSYGYKVPQLSKQPDEKLEAVPESNESKPETIAQKKETQDKYKVKF